MVRYQVVCAIDEPVDFFPVEIGVSGEAEPIDYLDGLELDVSDENGHEIVVLPTFLDKYAKRFLLVFLPKIAPGEERRIFIRYSWKGMWNELRSKGQETFEWTFKSKEQIPLLELEVLFSRGMRIDCKPVSNHPNSKIEPVVSDVEHFGFKYVIPQGQKGISSYKMLVKWDDTTQP